MEQHLLLHRAVVHWQAAQTAFIIAERFRNRTIKSVFDYEREIA